MRGICVHVIVLHTYITTKSFFLQSSTFIFSSTHSASSQLCFSEASYSPIIHRTQNLYKYIHTYMNASHLI